jgi:hypothetical protein
MEKKMNKFAALLTVSILTSFQVLASPIPQAKLQSFQQAMSKALDRSSLDCEFVKGEKDFSLESMYAALTGSQSGDVHMQSSHVSLVFNYTAANGLDRYTFHIKTSRDYKTVLTAEYEQQARLAGGQWEAQTVVQCK